MVRRDPASTVDASVPLQETIPETRHARLGDLHLAYQVVGNGPPDILLLDQWFGDLDAQWDVPLLAALRERLATFGRLIMFDKDGRFPPIPTSTLPTLEEFMADIPAVLDTVGSERAAPISNIGGGHPGDALRRRASRERVSSLILVDCFARFLEAPDFPISADRRSDATRVEIAEDETGRGVMIDLFAPSVAGDEHPPLGRSTSVARRRPAPRRSSASSTRATCATFYPRIRVLTLVIQRAAAKGFSVEHADPRRAHPGREVRRAARRGQTHSGRAIKTRSLPRSRIS